ncbi:H4MPT-linked C1 transfer pathway protein [Ideonella azotifigens]|uniref:Hydantoinase/oxoprolinase family protein n=1 Tax=Ideonella azotifigens TaxID=513160 RepID=A0ABN1JZC8_9BURK|nr:hydantoinase/oxoprolinase family protein [Ideonella azotifigens]MCD2342716.1 H4MPT-linked C1 transfer pathway protein [Ideonella azotifigens]
MPSPEPLHIVGWDIGGAHVKACLMRNGRVVDVTQWACPLWQGIEHLAHVLHIARARWPQFASATHAVTMTGEMTDLFEHREEGVQRIAATLADTLAPSAPGALHFFTGEGPWCPTAEVGAQWAHIASANWRATALHAAQCIAEGVLIDIGSTTTDLIAFRAGRVLGTSRSDAQRLASGELVYQGVVRTPLCALGPRVAWRGVEMNVMNEFFATTADVYRLTGELDPAHDLHTAADNAPKDLPATEKRLARMIGLDAREASSDDWLAFARTWRARQVDELASQLRRVVAAHGLSDTAVALSAGCGDFLIADVVSQAGPTREHLRYGFDVARIAADALPGTYAVARWAQVCAPAVAVAALLDTGLR